MTGRGLDWGWEGGLGTREVEAGHTAGARARRGPAWEGAGDEPHGGHPQLAQLRLPPGLLQLLRSRNQSLPVASEASGRSGKQSGPSRGPGLPSHPTLWAGLLQPWSLGRSSLAWPGSPERLVLGTEGQQG